ncbi:hypothetical protein PAXRUDRAFT_308222 [Paxillus rubicundulus Ve08.2h10]|uniref:PAS domain-containing protein n=1 Tax=Paxillus rubicundulus Ve08.2h10 TaxID=930991 RepID=A0A0D0DFI7_9AGAM|nr:hypothetical protein PAXRUDRAFT_308222 [Paxillus rubicundulus Ve08.2h10]
MDFNTPRVSCIAIVDFSEDARWLFVTESVTELLGYEPRDVIGQPALEMVHPDEFPAVRKLHYDTIRQDKAAVIAYLRIKHKDPFKGYILCAVSRTVVHNVLVGSISLAIPGPKAFQNASTAQEVVVLTPSAKDFEFRRWGDPSPMPPSPIPNISIFDDEPEDEGGKQNPGVPTPAPQPILSYKPLPSQSFRSALILDRFSIHCPIQYCSNDHLLSTTTVMGRSFFDFVAPRCDAIVRSWIDVIKAWGVNERGQPSEGGFGYGKFILLPKGRDSRNDRIPDAPSSRRREMAGPTKSHAARSQALAGSSMRSRLYSSVVSGGVTSPGEEVVVDAIFSGHSDGVLVILRATSPRIHT